MPLDQAPAALAPGGWSHRRRWPRAPGSPWGGSLMRGAPGRRGPPSLSVGEAEAGIEAHSHRAPLDGVPPHHRLVWEALDLDQDWYESPSHPENSACTSYPP